MCLRAATLRVQLREETQRKGRGRPARDLSLVERSRQVQTLVPHRRLSFRERVEGRVARVISISMDPTYLALGAIAMWVIDHVLFPVITTRWAARITRTARDRPG